MYVHTVVYTKQRQCSLVTIFINHSLMYTLNVISRKSSIYSFSKCFIFRERISFSERESSSETVMFA